MTPGNRWCRRPFESQAALAVFYLCQTPPETRFYPANYQTALIVAMQRAACDLWLVVG